MALLRIGNKKTAGLLRSSSCYQSLLLAKALPEWDLRYFSKDRALDRSLKARWVTRFQGFEFGCV